MKIIGLTGGIGSGKSTVSEYLISKGFHVLDADKVSREIVMPGSEMLIQLSSYFGKDILHEDGSLNRKKLANIIFNDAEKKKKLDVLMHNRVLEIIHERIILFREEYENSAELAIDSDKGKKRRVIFIDAPLLFETGLDKSVSETWVIDVDDETRIKRLMKRDGLSREEILMRIKTQMARDEKKKRADVLLENTGDPEKLYRQIDQMLELV
ncbi:MAG: dephospho-CoA kinase [Eubacteriales bacterium]|nr:dephospho-CoA kinase [Eubacteriales bacterium]